MNRKAFTIIESLAMIATILVFTMILAGIMRQKNIWPFDHLNAWLDSRKPIETPAK